MHWMPVSYLLTWKLTDFDILSRLTVLATKKILNKTAENTKSASRIIKWRQSSFSFFMVRGWFQIEMQLYAKYGNSQALSQAAWRTAGLTSRGFSKKLKGAINLWTVRQWKWKIRSTRYRGMVNFIADLWRQLPVESTIKQFKKPKLIFTERSREWVHDKQCHIRWQAHNQIHTATGIVLCQYNFNSMRIVYKFMSWKSRPWQTWLYVRSVSSLISLT